jgi:MoaA/NifB/PqqE/SkfB family radical SAM enzyme
VQRIVDEADTLGFGHFFFTGGEPFILDEIYDMLAYAVARGETTVLTNAMLLQGKRLERLAAIANDDLVVQVSLDGATAEQHDAYRGAGTWVKTVEAIRRLQAKGFRLRLSTTETAANTQYLDEVRAFGRSLGIAGGDHLVRPLARRGFAQEGLEVGLDNLDPEVTVTAHGIFWHPVASPSSADLRISTELFPLSAAVECIQQQLEEMGQPERERPQAVT